MRTLQAADIEVSGLLLLGLRVFGNGCMPGLAEAMHDAMRIECTAAHTLP
jgi:hypothetical protein